MSRQSLHVLAAVATMTAGLSPADRARLAAMLLGQQPGQREAARE
jgi:hypothetical protein